MKRPKAAPFRVEPGTGMPLDIGNGETVVDEGLDGYSVVEIKGNRMAVGADSTNRYVRVR